MMKKKFMVFVLVAVMVVSVFALCACGKKDNGGGTSSGETTGGADETGGDAQGVTGKTVEMVITNSHYEEGTLSAMCPDGWYDHSDDEDLFFSESDTAGDFTKPYIKVHYTGVDLSVGGSGDDTRFDRGGMAWAGLYNDEYDTYNVITIFDEGGGISVVSLGAGPDDAIYKAVLESIEVSF